MTPRRHAPPPPTPEINLLCEILRGIPRLPGARCRTQPEVFDAAHPSGRDASSPRHVAAARAAAAMCQRCPALPACRAWLEALPANQRPLGIVAGQLTTTKGTETL